MLTHLRQWLCSHKGCLLWDYRPNGGLGLRCMRCLWRSPGIQTGREPRIPPALPSRDGHPVPPVALPHLCDWPS